MQDIYLLIVLQFHYIMHIVCCFMNIKLVTMTVFLSTVLPYYNAIFVIQPQSAERVPSRLERGAFWEPFHYYDTSYKMRIDYF